MVEPALFGPLDSTLGAVIEWVLLVLVVANLLTRFLAYRAHVRQAKEGAEAIERHPFHVASNVLLILASFYYATISYHAGLLLSILVVCTVIADVFELEARKVEAREDRTIEKPKGALVASLLVAGYVGYLTLFFLIEGPFSAIV